MPRTTLTDRIKAARVMTHMRHMDGASDKWRHLAEIHAAPQWLWRALVAALVKAARVVSGLNAYALAGLSARWSHLAELHA